MGVLLDNPIAAVQMDLRGGWKNFFIVVGVYALIVAICMGLWAGLETKHIHRAAVGWTESALVLQLLIVVLFSIVRVAGAIRQDRSSGIIESHRLMPITGAAACVGYVIGPIATLFGIGCINLVAGCIAASVAELDVSRFVAANVILAAFCAFGCLWGLTMGFYRRALFNTVIILFILSFITGGIITYVLPGLLLLFTPFAGDSIFSMTGPSAFKSGHWAGFAAQIIFGAIAVQAVSRKFRRPDLEAFPLYAGLTLQAAWLACSLYCILNWQKVMLMPFRGSDPDANRLKIQFTATLVSLMLLSLLPISSAIRKSRRAPQRSSAKMTSLLPPLTTLICAAICGSLLFLPTKDSVPVQRLGAIGLIIIAELFAFFTILSRSKKTGVAVRRICVFVLLLWVAPLLADVVYHSTVLSSYDSNYTPWSIAAFGPIGIILAPWDIDVPVLPGVVIQCGIAAALMLIAVARRQKSPAVPAVAPAVSPPIIPPVAALP